MRVGLVYAARCRYREVFMLHGIKQYSVGKTDVRLAIKSQTNDKPAAPARRLLGKSLERALGSMLADTFSFLGAYSAPR